MLIVLALFAALTAVDGCAPEPVVIASESTLRPGPYVIVVDAIGALACDGAEPEELVGATLPGELRVGADGRAVLLLPGWAPVDGEHGAGWLAAEGALVAERGPEPVPAEPDVTDTASRDAACMDVPDDEEDDAAEPRPEGPWVGLDVDVYAEDGGSGDLLIAFPGCEAELYVTLRPAPIVDEGVVPPVGEDDAPVVAPGEDEGPA